MFVRGANTSTGGAPRDDAAGEAFDKVAKILDILREGEVTMGGPRISMLAEEGDPQAFDFPRALIDDPGFDFSFSGLKTSVLYRVRDLLRMILKLFERISRRVFKPLWSMCSWLRHSKRRKKPGQSGYCFRVVWPPIACCDQNSMPGRPNSAWMYFIRPRPCVQTTRR